MILHNILNSTDKNLNYQNNNSSISDKRTPTTQPYFSPNNYSVKPTNQTCERTQKRRMERIKKEFDKINEWLSKFDLEIKHVDLIDKKRQKDNSNQNSTEKKHNFEIHYSREDKELKCDAFRALKVKFLY